MMMLDIDLQHLWGGIYCKAHVWPYVNLTHNTSIPMLPESAKQQWARIPHNKFRENVNPVYITHGQISIYAHMYGTLHSIDMDANQNGQHLINQITFRQLKIGN